MARKKPPEAGVPEWILTYGDMMSLLLCFFIMLYAISTLEVVKVQAAIESLSEGFGYRGAARAPTDRQANASKQRINSTGRAKRLEVFRGGQPVVAPQGPDAKVQTIKVDADPITGGLIFFELGSDELNENGKRQLAVVFGHLVGSPFKILVSGHAGPDEHGPYRDVMDLAYARAMAVQRHLIELGTTKLEQGVKQSLKPNFFRVSSYGSSEPIARTLLPPGAEPRQANAFVEIQLLRDTVRDLESDKTEQQLRRLDDLPSS